MEKLLHAGAYAGPGLLSAQPSALPSELTKAPHNLRVAVKPARLTGCLVIPGWANVPLPMPLVHGIPKLRGRYPGQLGLAQGGLTRQPLPAPRTARPRRPRRCSYSANKLLREYEEQALDFFMTKLESAQANPMRARHDNTVSLAPLAKALRAALSAANSHTPRARQVVAEVLGLLGAHGGPLPARLALAMLALLILREAHPEQFADCRALLAGLIDKVAPQRDIDARAAIFLLMPEYEQALPLLATRLHKQGAVTYATAMQSICALKWWRPEIDELSREYAFAPALPDVLLYLLVLLKLQGGLCHSSVRAACLKELLLAVARHQSREDDPVLLSTFFRKWMKQAEGLDLADALPLLWTLHVELHRLESWRVNALYQPLLKQLLMADAWLAQEERATRALHAGHQQGFVMQALLHLELQAGRGGTEAASVPATARLLNDWLDLSTAPWSEAARARLAKLIPFEEGVQDEDWLDDLDSLTKEVKKFQESLDGKVEEIQQTPCSIS